MKKYRAEQFLSITGSECGTEVEVRQLVTFTVVKGWPETRLTPAERDTVDDVVIRHFIGEHPGAREIKLPDRIILEFEESKAFNAWLISEANAQEEALIDAAMDREPGEFSGFPREVLDTVVYNTQRGA